MKKCPPDYISYLRYLVKMKHHISYLYNALLEEVHLLRQAWCETQSSSGTRKEIDSYKLCSKCPPGRQMCVYVQLTFLTLSQFFDSRNHSCAMCMVFCFL